MQSIACHLVPPSSAATACMRVGQFARKEVHRRPLEPLKNSDLIVREFLNQKLQLHVAALLRWAAARADHESAKVEYRRRWLKLLHQEPVLPDREQFLRETYEQLMSDVTLLHLRKIGSPVQPLHPEVKAWLQPHYDQHCTDWRGDGEEPYEWEDWLEEWFDPEYCGVQMPIWVAHAFKRGVNYGRCDETGMVDA